MILGTYALFYHFTINNSHDYIRGIYIRSYIAIGPIGGHRELNGFLVKKTVSH